MSTQEGHLKRELNIWDLTMVSVGGIIGGGWLYGAWKGAALAGPSAILSWVIGGVAVLLLALCYAELGGMFPEAGALVRFPQYSHGSLVSFIMGWAMIIGFLFWGDMPTLGLLAGSAIVVGSGLFLLWRETGKKPIVSD